MKELPKKHGGFGKREEDDHGFYDGVLAGIGAGLPEIERQTISWAMTHRAEIEEAAGRGVISAENLLQILNNIKR